VESRADVLRKNANDSLVREVQEETGIVVEPEVLTGVYKNMRYGIVALVFRCRVASGTPHTTDEVTEIAWLTPEQVRGRMDEAFAIRLLDALEPGPAAIRAHDGLTLLPA
jgi:8-oxo-dGTP diphosphatase